MKFSKLLSSACLLLASVSLQAQTNFRPAFYITLQSDTVYGEIDDRGDARNARVCTFRSGEGQATLSFDPGDIIAYRFTGGGKYYISREIPLQEETQTVFLEYLVNGISDLYYYRGQAQGRYYIESEDGQFTELSNDIVTSKVNGVDYTRSSNLFVGQMKASFGDCPEIQPKLDRARFSHKSLIQLTSEYHDYVCDDQECIIYEKRLPAVLVSGGFYTGLMRSGLDFPDYEGSDTDFAFDAAYKWYHYYSFNTTNDLLFGLRLRVTMPRANDRLAMLFLAEYSQSEHLAYAEDQTEPGLLTLMEAHARLSSLNLMPGLQYSFPGRRLRPSLALGPVFSMDLNSSFNMQHTLVSDGPEIVQNFHTTPIRGMVLGGFSQLGLDWGIGGGQNLGCSLRAHFTRQRTDHYVNREGISVSLDYSYTFNRGIK
jgi:hypothetical protein